jgi:hypothetical protein
MWGGRPAEAFPLGRPRSALQPVERSQPPQPHRLRVGRLGCEPPRLNAPRSQPAGFLCASLPEGNNDVGREQSAKAGTEDQRHRDPDEKEDGAGIDCDSYKDHSEGVRLSATCLFLGR